MWRRSHAKNKTLCKFHLSGMHFVRITSAQVHKNSGTHAAMNVAKNRYIIRHGISLKHNKGRTAQQLAVPDSKTKENGTQGKYVDTAQNRTCHKKRKNMKESCTVMPM